MARKLGKTQAIVLEILQTRTPVYEIGGGGWTWSNASTTARILDGLVKRGLVANEKIQGQGYSLEHWGRYTITEAGRAYDVQESL